MTLAELLASRPHVLLDFDGPICAVFGGVGARNITRRLAATLRQHGVELPPDLAESDDPFAVLRHVAAVAPGLATVAEQRFRELEVEAVAAAPLTPGFPEALNALVASGHTVTIVSNNSEAAVRAFLDGHELRSRVNGVAARTEPDPELLKPAAHLIWAAMGILNATPGTCVLLGDSVTDITAARAAGVSAVGFANKPGKRERLLAAAPDAIIDRMTAIVRATVIEPSTHLPHG